MYASIFKRCIDFSISFLVLLLISPILLIITLSLHFANKGAGAFFTQERPGKDEKIFKVIKFKSMTDERDKNGALLPDKERITSIGKFIRKTSLDELPQLINVLKGDMALIGPRPLLVRYLPFYTEKERPRHSVRPGITGLAQISGRNNLSWEKRLKMDVEYAENVTFMNDVNILFKTVWKVLKSENVVTVLDPNINKPLDVYRKEQNQCID